MTGLLGKPIILDRTGELHAWEGGQLVNLFFD